MMKFNSREVLGKFGRKSKNWYIKFSLPFKKPKYDGKIFCIGFNKTGTTSLGRALELLGYKHSSFNKKIWRKCYANNEIVKILQYTAKFDSLDDLPWLKEDMIPILDKVFPNSKFIYLARDEESWKKSIYHWTYKKTNKYPDLDLELTKFRQHKKFVLKYFENRSKESFLTLNIKDQDGFKKLAEFLGKTTNQSSFPHHNKTF